MKNHHPFLKSYEIINNNLPGLEINRVFNSIGANVFFEFGKDLEILLKNGKKISKKEWSIWISNSSWRITKNKKYIVGSSDSSSLIQSNIQQLMGKKFQKLSFLSSFLDVEFNFEDEYKITTFFNWLSEDQWTIFLPNQANIAIDASNHEEIDVIQKISEKFTISEDYKANNCFQSKSPVRAIIYERNQPTFHFEDNTSILIEDCTWRLTRDNEYLIGCLDNGDEIKNLCSKLVGKKLKQIEINPFMDAKFHFEDQYLFHTFSCSNVGNQWEILKNSTPINIANLHIK